MNFKYHSLVGIVGTLVTQDPMFFVGSIVPDITMAFNEYRLIKNKVKFNEDEVPNWITDSYRYLHSYFIILFLVYFFSPVFVWGYFFHLFFDMFTHIGKFSAVPFYPFFKYQVKFGRNILK